MQDQIKNLISNLTAFSENLAAFDDVEEQLGDATIQLDAVKKEHSQVVTKLATNKGLLDKARQEATAKHDVEMFEKTKELRQLTASVNAKSTELADLNAQINTARSDHNDVLASFESLRKRIG